MVVTERRSFQSPLNSVWYVATFVLRLFPWQIRFFSPPYWRSWNLLPYKHCRVAVLWLSELNKALARLLDDSKHMFKDKKSEFRIKLIWFAVNGIITIHCNVTIITAAETYVHQIHHEWFHYGTRRYQWGTCSSFPYRSKTQRSAFVLGWRRAQIDTATHCTMPVRRRAPVHPLFTLGLNSARAVRGQAASGG